MTIRSQTMATKDWCLKAPEYVQEAENMGIRIHGPNVQQSNIGFSIVEKEIYFGLNAIRNVGITGARSVMQARGNRRFKDVNDFVFRIDRQKANTKVFAALIYAGAFDRMGYDRNELLTSARALYDYPKDYQDSVTRDADIVVRDRQNIVVETRREEIRLLVKEAKALNRKALKANLPVSEETEYWVEYTQYIKDLKAKAADIKQAEEELENHFDQRELKDYLEAASLRKLPALKPKPKPEVVIVSRSTTISLSVDQLIMQADYIGCYLGDNPAAIIFPEAEAIAAVEDCDYTIICGVVTKVKEIMTKAGDPMAFLQIGDGTAMAEIVVFPKQFKRFHENKTFPAEKDLAQFAGRIKGMEPITMLADQVEIYRRPE
jgi:DNA polymerase III alpha subunit